MTTIQIYNKNADILNILSAEIGVTVASVIEMMIKQYDKQKDKDKRNS